MKKVFIIMAFVGMLAACSTKTATSNVESEDTVKVEVVDTVVVDSVAVDTVQ